MLLNNIKIVLSRVSEPGNVGAVCRVMKNMGLSTLRLIPPEHGTSVPLDKQKIYTRAVHSFDIWENAAHFDTLAESVKDCSIVVGTTRRRGQYRKNVSMTPRALAEWLKEQPGSAAIVFGNERTGLEEEELNLCNIASHIPADEIQPSLNLSHAVQVYAYELFLAFRGSGVSASSADQGSVKGNWIPMTQEKIEELVKTVSEHFEKVGFYKQHGREEQERFLRDVIARAGLSEKEGKYFKDLLIKAARI